MLHTVLTFLFGGSVTIALIVAAILVNPEKIEKWFALFWKLVDGLRIGIRLANKKYVEHDIQGSVNEFVKLHSEEMPGFEVRGVKLEWVDADVKRQSFLEADRVVVRVKRDDPHHENFVKAVYLFVSSSLLYRAKRYISPPQGRAIDLFVTTALFKEQKPEVVHHFLEEYLHPQIDDGSARVTELFEAFDVLEKGGIFFPVFLQEMDYLGQKVFGRAKQADIVTEVNALIEFLKSVALRRVGDDNTDLNFIQKYCRCAFVIVGKPVKINYSISPYVHFIRESLDRDIETVYLLGRATNETPMRDICTQVADLYEFVGEKKVSKVVLYGEEKRHIEGFVAVLRSKNRPLYAAAGSRL